MKAQELIELINGEPLYSLWDADDVIGSEATMVAKGLKLDIHRWYSKAVNVYKCDDGFVGVCGPYQLFSEEMVWSDTEACKAALYKEVKTVTYKPL